MQRITELKIQNFRVYKGQQTIPLDAETVIVYGPNGSGKTSLFSAIEYAITGEVAYLKKIAEDYPRCLKNVDATKLMDVTIDYQENDVKHSVNNIPFQSKKNKPSKKALFTPVEKRFFLERCYLSQVFLTHLLEAYQTTGGNGSQQPVLEFVRKLLDFDILENLTSGLHVMGDARRIEKVVNAIPTLTNKKDMLVDQVTNLEKQITDKKDDLQKLEASVQDEAANMSLSIQIAPLTIMNLREQIKVTQEKLASCCKSIENTHMLRSKLDDSLKRLDLPETGGFFQSWGVYAKFLRIRKRRRMLEADLEKITRQTHDKLRSLDLIYEVLISKQNAQKQQDFDVELHELEIALPKSIAHFDRQIATINNFQADLKIKKERLNSFEKKIKELEIPQDKSIQSKERLCSTLLTLSEYVEGEICPTCGRDYSEVSKKGLRKQITDNINKLNVDINEIKSKLGKYKKLKAEREGIVREIEDIKTELKKIQCPIVEMQKKQQQLSEAIKSIKASKEIREEWRWLSIEEKQLDARLKRLKLRKSKLKSSRREVLNILKQLGVSIDNLPERIKPLKDKTEHIFNEKIHDIENKKSILENIINNLENMGRILQGINELTGEHADLKKEQEQVDAALTNVNKQITIARKLAKAAQNTKAKLLNAVFNEKLNSLWVNIFQRLARFQRFKPMFSNPELSHNRILTKIQGVAEGIEPFALKAIQSSGNLNIAALSLFLALHLIEKPKHSVLLLDDPIQNMDDVHCINLASLLRNLVYEMGRQVIVAVHERAMFNYLCLELGPKKEGQNLIAIELDRDIKSYNVIVKAEKISWDRDALKLSTC